MPLSTPVCLNGTPGLREMLRVGQIDASQSARRRPLEAAMAESGDLGFAAGVQDGGSYVTLLKRSASCAWAPVLDETIPHPTVPATQTGLVAQQAEWVGTGLPPERLLAVDAAGGAMTDFRRVVQQEGLAAALRTYGRNYDFRLYIEGSAPFEGMDAANAYLSRHSIQGDLQEQTQGRSIDGTMTYASGGLLGSTRQRAYGCLQIWQFDAKVVNWGVRVLLLNRPPRTV